jgi:hypothetical protein
MPTPRIRFKVRHVMLLVLLVAALLGTFEAGRRWERQRPRSASRIRPAVNVR